MKKIERNALYECKSLQKVVFEKGSKLKELSIEAFSGCIGLKNINLPEGLKSIGEGCFENTSLARVTLPSSVTFFHDDSFPENTIVTQSTHFSPEEVLTAERVRNILQSQQNIRSFRVPEGTKRLDVRCFRGTEIEEVFILKSVEEIGLYAFSGCQKLERVVFEEGSELKEL